MFVRSTLSGLPLAPEGRGRAQVALIHLAAFGMRSNERLLLVIFRHSVAKASTSFLSSRMTPLDWNKMLDSSIEGTAMYMLDLTFS